MVVYSVASKITHKCLSSLLPDLRPFTRLTDSAFLKNVSLSVTDVKNVKHVCYSVLIDWKTSSFNNLNMVCIKSRSRRVGRNSIHDMKGNFLILHVDNCTVLADG